MRWDARPSGLRNDPVKRSVRHRRAGLATAIGLSASLAAPAGATPQWSSGAVAAACLVDEANRATEVAFCGALRTDVLFGRESTADIGLGPYLTLGTAAFNDLRGTLGGSVLLPLFEDFPLVVSAGGLATSAAQYGVDAELFFGVRSHNFHGVYNFASGVVLGVQQGFAAPASRALSVGVQVDGVVLALPFLLALGALR